MRTNIDIDDKLMKAAMKASGKKTKRETVEEALRAYVRTKDRPKMLDLFGKLDWDGYPIDEIRRDKTPVAALDVSRSLPKLKRVSPRRAGPRARRSK